MVSPLLACGASGRGALEETPILLAGIRSQRPGMTLLNMGVTRNPTPTPCWHAEPAAGGGTRGDPYYPSWHSEPELELELTQPHMAQKPVLRGEVGCACVARSQRPGRHLPKLGVVEETPCSFSAEAASTPLLPPAPRAQPPTGPCARACPTTPRLCRRARTSSRRRASARSLGSAGSRGPWGGLRGQGYEPHIA